MSWLYSIIISGLLISSGSDNIATEFFLDREGVVAHTAVSEPADDVTDRFEATYKLSATGRISVSNINGSITIESWDRNEVRLEAVKIADSAETLAEVEIKIADRPDHLKIETDYRNMRYSAQNRSRKIEVNYKLTVPRNASLDSIETVNGSVNITGVHGLTKASAVNGMVNATDLRGNAELSTVNGGVVAEFENIEAGSRVTLNTVNGTARISLPSDLNATLKADSLNGSIVNEFGLPVKRGEYVGRNLYGRVGNGATQIKLNSVNGGLSILRRKDGRPLNPATDLLESRAADNIEDAAKKTAVEAKKNAAMTRANKQAAIAILESQRDVEVAMKAAQAEMIKITPELKKAQAQLKVEGIKAGIERDMIEQTAVLANLAALSTVAWRNPAPTVQRRTSTFEVNGTPKVIIETLDCDVIVRGTDSSTVRYVLSEFGAMNNITPAGITENRSGNEIRINVAGDKMPGIPGSRMSVNRVRLEVYVPKKSDLSIRSDGEVRVGNISGTIDVKGEDGSIDIRDSQGKLRLAAEDGQIRVIGFSGELDSEVADGDVYLEGRFDRLTSKAVDGKVTLTVPDDLNAVMTSTNDIEAAGTNGKKENPRRVVFGDGSAKYDFNFEDGSLIVRSARSIIVD